MEWFPLAAAAEDQPAAISSEPEAFFERQIRPLLAANCWECHGAKKQESGLRLDSRQGALEGGDSGERAVVPGDPDRSLLVKAVKHIGDYHMPPNRKLTQEQIAALAQWIKAGAPWPAAIQASEQKPLAAELARDHRRTHWAYQPVMRPPLPALRDAGWPRSRLDAFILGRLESAGLSPSPEADRRTLIRRLSFDLTGLPPYCDEFDEFSASPSVSLVEEGASGRVDKRERPDWYERYADKLLASPRYGERWGRHWLDVARYADTKGYAFAQERRYPYAYTYRDYVIRALNADLPYDRFVVEQLAADRLPLGDDKSPLAALGFLTTGRKFNNRHDDIDDQIDAVTRGLMGITVACARCHDHKYDAIPTEDYYSLYGVFANCSEPRELPLLAPPDELEFARQTEEYRKFEEELARLRGEFEKFAAERHADFLDQARRQSADYLARVAAGETVTLLAKLPFLSLDPIDLRPRLIDRWRRFLDEHARPDHPVLGLWHDLLKVPADHFGEQSGPVLAGWLSRPEGTAAGMCNPLVRAAFADDPPATRMDVPRIYGKLFTEVYQTWKQAHASEDSPAEMTEAAQQVADVLLGKDSPTDIALEDARQFLSRADRNKYQELQKKVETFQANSPLAPPRAMVVEDSPKPTEPRVLIRGNPARPGGTVPRQFLLVLHGESRQPFDNGSGRLDLARAIVAPENPLTRRVIINRLWMHHFGEPLVASPSDFGIRCDPPTHPELLDDLAMRLLDKDWSLKALHREIVCSATYRQASLGRPDCRAVDSENRLLWRMNRRRLELEAIRDTLLAVSGRLDLRMYGRPVELTKPPFPARRAIYGFIDRQDLPGMFRVFDIASPDQSSPRRPRTTVPQQALFFMNSPFVIEQAQALAARPEVAAAGDEDAQIAALYRLLFGRQPDTQELDVGRGFLSSAAAPPAGDMKLSPLEPYAQLLLLTNEMMYVD